MVECEFCGIRCMRTDPNIRIHSHDDKGYLFICRQCDAQDNCIGD